MSNVALLVNGTMYEGWKGVSVGRGLESLTGSFSLSVSDIWAPGMEPAPIEPDDACQVLIDDEPVITGYVDDTETGMSGNSVSFTVAGRDKTCDLVDCSAEADSYEFLDMTVADIARELSKPFGIAVKVETAVGDPFKRHAVQPGETAWNCLERAARQRGILCTTDCRGSLVLATPGSLRASDRIVQGKNLLAGTSRRSHKDRYSHYIVNGQEPTWYVGDTEPRPNAIGKAGDKNVKRYRPLIINAEMQCDSDTARQRAENEATQRAGRSTSFPARVQDWRQSNGELWLPNMVVTVDAPRLHVRGVVFIIASLAYTVDDRNGTVTDMELKRPDAFLYNTKGEVKNDWYN